jgi:hypothetical protein
MVLSNSLEVSIIGSCLFEQERTEQTEKKV